MLTFSRFKYEMFQQQFKLKLKQQKFKVLQAYIISDEEKLLKNECIIQNYVV